MNGFPQDDPIAGIVGQGLAPADTDRVREAQNWKNGPRQCHFAYDFL